MAETAEAAAETAEVAGDTIAVAIWSMAFVCIGYLNPMARVPKVIPVTQPHVLPDKKAVVGLTTLTKTKEDEEEQTKAATPAPMKYALEALADAKSPGLAIAEVAYPVPAPRDATELYFMKGFWEKRFKPQEKKPRANLQIRAPQLRVIDENGQQLGILDVSPALKIAHEKGLDLIEINPNSEPPIAKIMDYGKYMYLKERGEKGKKQKKTGQQEIKTIKIGLKTGAHDLKVKSALADKFLEKNNKVRVEIFLKGREKAFRNLARDKVNGFLAYITQVHIVEDSLKSSPTGFSIILRPDK